MQSVSHTKVHQIQSEREKAASTELPVSQALMEDLVSWLIEYSRARWVGQSLVVTGNAAKSVRSARAMVRMLVELGHLLLGVLVLIIGGIVRIVLALTVPLRSL